MRMYKGIGVAKGSALLEALELLDKAKGPSDTMMAQINVKKIFNDTTERFEKMYSKEDRDWFFAQNNKGYV